MAQARRASTMSRSELAMPAELDQSPVLGIERSRELFANIERAAKSFGVRDVEALFGAHRGSLTRFANNAIHQNVSEQGQWISVRVQMDRKTARATTNRFDADSIRRVVEQAIVLTKSVAADPDLLPLAEPSVIPEIARFDPATAAASPMDRARAVAEAV